MRSSIKRATALLLGALVGVGFLLAPQASAQELNESREFFGIVEVLRPDGCTDVIEQVLVTTLIPDEEYTFTGDSFIEETTTIECPDDPAVEDEVLGEVLAFSGSNLDKPIAFGASMIGLGGLLLMVARKRQHDAADEPQELVG